MIETAVPNGYDAVTPYLVVKDASAAIAFYQNAFGAAEQMRLVVSSGAVVHAQVQIGGSFLMITEDNPELGNHSPQSPHGSSGHLHLYVANVDEVFSRALAAGAKSLIPVDDPFYGDRSGRLIDPFGHIWIIATRKQEMSRDAMQRRLDAALK
ncbi:MAG: VOC family protein, partial [Candidatus Saccharimonadales bacterium]